MTEEEALCLLKELRQVDARLGVRNSRIAFDVAMALYEAQEQDGTRALSVDQLSDITGFSGPTVRLVLKRLGEIGTIETSRRIGKTQFYCLTASGRAGFAGYVDALCAFRGGGRGAEMTKAAAAAGE